MFYMLLALSCASPGDTSEGSEPTYREERATISEEGYALVYDLGLVYIPMFCPAGDMGGCYPAVPGVDYVVRLGVMSAWGEPGDVFVVGHFVR